MSFGIRVGCSRATSSTVSRAISRLSAQTSTTRTFISNGTTQLTSASSRYSPLINTPIGRRRYFSAEAASKKAEDTTGGGENADDGEALVKIMPGGVKQLKRLLKKDPDRFLRLTVNSGGCSGYRYEFKMDKELAEQDRVFEQDGVKVVVDDLSLDFLGTCEVDYTSEMIRASFQVVSNSNAEAGCGCGASFSVGSGF